MEQLEQLVAIRDAADKRLEEARAAIERSPDAKLVASLTLLIDDLRKSFAADGQTDAVPAAATESLADPEPAGKVDDGSAIMKPATESAPEAPGESGADGASEMQEAASDSDDDAAAEEFSLEDSLEAELLKVK